MTIQCTCGKTLSENASLHDNKPAPKPGDITLCGYCGKMYQFDENGIAQPVSKLREMDIIALSPSHVQEHIRAIRLAIYRMKKQNP